MVNGISGVSAGISAAEIKELVQETVEEILESKEAKAAQALESQDEDTIIEEDEATSTKNTENEALKENSLMSFANLLTSLTNMMTTMMNTMMEMLGLSKNDDVQGADSTDKTDDIGQTNITQNTPHVYTKDEQIFIEKYEWYLKDIIAEEKLTSDPDVAKSLLGSDYSWEEKIVAVASTVTDAEIEEYLSKNPDVINQGILESSTWDSSTKTMHKGLRFRSLRN